MAELKLLTDRLIETKRLEMQKKIQEAQAQAAEKVAETEKALEEDKLHKSAQIDQQLQTQYEQDKNALAVKKRNQLLAEKQKALTLVFDQAKAQMENWDDTQFKAFLLGVLQQFEADEGITLVLGEKSTDKLTADWLKEETADLYPIDLSKEVISKKAGFLIRHKGIDYNYFFEDMIEDSKEELVADVSQRLFQ